MHAPWSLLVALSCLIGPAPTPPGSRVEIQLERGRFEAISGLSVGCQLYAYTNDGPWRLVLGLPSNGFVPSTSVSQVVSDNMGDPAACKRIAAAANSPRGGSVRGKTVRRVFDTRRVVGDRCVRLLEEEFELTIDGSAVPLRGSVNFRIGQRPMNECTAR